MSDWENTEDDADFDDEEMGLEEEPTFDDDDADADADLDDDED